MGGPLTCAVKTRIVHDHEYFYAIFEKNISMIIKADAHRARATADSEKAGTFEHVSGTPVAADKVKPDTWKAHLECRAHLNNFQTGS